MIYYSLKTLSELTIQSRATPTSAKTARGIDTYPTAPSPNTTTFKNKAIKIFW